MEECFNRELGGGLGGGSLISIKPYLIYCNRQAPTSLVALLIHKTTKGSIRL